MATMSDEKIKNLFHFARKAHEAGQLVRAEKEFSQILKQRPNLAEVHFNLGQIYTKQGRNPDASRSLETALKLRPKEPAIWVAYVELALLHPDETILAQLVARSAKHIQGHPVLDLFRGYLAHQKKDPAAITHFQRALGKGVIRPRGFTQLAEALISQGREDDALEVINDGLKALPDNTLLFSRKADLLRDMGRFDEAVIAAKAAIETEPENGHLYYSLGTIQKIKADDPIIARMQALFRKKSAKDKDRPHLGFALAKAAEDTGETDQIFRHLSIANKDIDKAFPYNHASDQHDAAQMRDLFPKLQKTLPTGGGCGDAWPIFVTGMPRSGTTLVEQIISSHSQVTGGGEMGLLSPWMAQFMRIAKDTDASDPDALSTSLEIAGQGYAQTVAKKFPQTKYVTDKSIGTFASIGYAKRMLPNARIIVVKRDPRDNALSIYKNMFKPGDHRYSTNLRNIALFYKLFEQQVAFWKTQMPDDVYEIRYEDLIADPEAQSHALIKAAGLEWEDACLSFYENKRRVQTISAAQVRRPIYSSSVGAWRRHEKDLAPFLEELGRVGPD